jgi:anaerobic magnesium-protoporphyrin IX monomethyl ester cyclase
MDVLCSFMFPHPDDTEATIREQKAFMRRLVDMNANVSLALTTPFPGTPYFENADALGIRILTDRWDEFDGKHLVIATKHLSEARLQRLLEELMHDVGLRSDATPAYGG